MEQALLPLLKAGPLIYAAHTSGFYYMEQALLPLLKAGPLIYAAHTFLRRDAFKKTILTRPQSDT